jgi:hypothetical protein
MPWGSATRCDARPDANEARDWRIYAELAQRLIVQARRLYTNEDLGFDLANTIYALDSTTIDLCLAVFPWAHFRATKASPRCRGGRRMAAVLMIGGTCRSLQAAAVYFGSRCAIKLNNRAPFNRFWGAPPPVSIFAVGARPAEL